MSQVRPLSGAFLGVSHLKTFSPPFIWHSHHHVPVWPDHQFGSKSLGAFPTRCAPNTRLDRGCGRMCPGRRVPAPYTPNAWEGIESTVQGGVVPSRAVDDIACKRICESLCGSRECIKVQVLESAKLVGHFHNGELALKRPTDLVHDDWRNVRT